MVEMALVEMAISTNQKPTIYRNLYENTGPGSYTVDQHQANIGSMSCGFWYGTDLYWDLFWDVHPNFSPKTGNILPNWAKR